MQHAESQIQQACIRWFKIQYPRLVILSIPNGYKTSASQARIAKAEGLLAGAADILLACPSNGYHALFVEMKTPKGRQQPSQRTFQSVIESFGYKYVICRSLEDFMTEIRAYLSKKR